MSRYLLRIEAVNFANFIHDSSDLSTVRGGGLLLLDAPQSIENPGIAGVTGWKKIYAGASTALFEFTLADGVEPERVRKDVEALLHTEGRAEATIMVDLEEYADRDFQKKVASLTSRNRLRQLQTPSFIYPATANAPGIDEIDDKRPGFERDDMRRPIENGQTEGRKMILSDTTYLRRKNGQDEKRHFYKRVKYDPAGWEDFPFHDGEYVNDFEQLAGYPEAEPSDLDGKIAYIYLDGNKFGSVARSCADPDKLGRWSDVVQANQNSFVNWLMRVRTGDGDQTPWHWSGEPFDNLGHKKQKTRAFRIETLMWGGDEIVWVVPAWCGWWVLGSFFRYYGQLPWKPEAPVQRTTFTADGNSSRLTHGAALIFCHAQAPIRRIDRLAKHLADAPKKVGTDGRTPDAYGDYFTYQVLESFDHLGTEIENVRAKRLPPCLRTLDPSPLVLSGGGMLDVFEHMQEFRRRFPRSKLHSLAHSVVADEADCLKAADHELKRAGLQNEFQRLNEYFGAQVADSGHKTKATWLHIAELWDYTHQPNWTPAPVPNIP